MSAVLEREEVRTPAVKTKPLVVKPEPAWLTLVKRARDLLSDQQCWCTQAFARTIYGEDVGPNSQHAVRWCAAGALAKYTPVADRFWMDEDYVTAVMHLADELGCDVAIVNDGDDGYARVMAAFDRVIEKGETQ